MPALTLAEEILNCWHGRFSRQGLAVLAMLSFVKKGHKMKK